MKGTEMSLFKSDGEVAEQRARAHKALKTMSAPGYSSQYLNGSDSNLTNIIVSYMCEFSNAEAGRASKSSSGEMNEQRARSVPDVCQVCGLPNPLWFTPNEVWNDLIPDRAGYLCPTCFASKNFETTWVLIPEFWEPQVINTLDDLKRAITAAEVDRATKELQVQHNAEDAADYFAVLQRAEAAETALAEAQKDTARLREAATYLKAEVSALKAFWPAVVEIIGFSNWRCLQRRRDELDAVLAESPSKETK